MTARPRHGTRVMVVGSGWHMTSGISHYTYRLSTALAERHQVSALLMRRLVPRRVYPGAARVGAFVTDAAYPEHVPVYDGVDWYWGRSMRAAIEFMDRERPEVVILQWWTGAVLHSYLRLASHAARHGARVIMEWHESQDVGEAGLPGTRRYVGSLMPWLLAWSAAHVVHSDFDLGAITSAYPLGMAPVRVIGHGPYDHLAPRVPAAGASRPDGGPMRLLYLGLVRPFKGVEDLVEAFSGLDRGDAERFRLTIVGETWEGWSAPEEAIGRSPHADLIERVDRYVTDTELAEYFASADAVVLPYHRSSASGPLQIAMSAGLPVVVTSVGGLVEAVRDYPGALLVPPQDVPGLRAALLGLPARRGQRYADPHSWELVADEFTALIDQLRGGAARRADAVRLVPAQAGPSARAVTGAGAS
jgi:glycosyltransferase involved in cell wall biosynthesis